MFEVEAYPAPEVPCDPSVARRGTGVARERGDTLDGMDSEQERASSLAAAARIAGVTAPLTPPVSIGDAGPTVTVLSQGDDFVVGDVVDAGSAQGAAPDSVETVSVGGRGEPDEPGDVGQGSAAPVEGADAAPGGCGPSARGRSS